MDQYQEILTGKSEVHLTELPQTSNPVKIHLEMKSDYLRLRQSAAEAGFDLQIISGFRSFERQLKLWNEKCRGVRAIHNERGEEVDIHEMWPEHIVKLIMRFMAIPGTSRHHWGTDVDVFDFSKINKDYDIKLSSDEMKKGGVNGDFHLWLDQQILEGKSFNFFRPYEKDKGGVSVEKWHLSYYPLSSAFYRDYNFELFYKTILNSTMIFKEIILHDAEKYFEKYVQNINLPAYLEIEEAV